MASRRLSRKDKILARLVDLDDGSKASCAFCGRDKNDEVVYGKLYAIGDIKCHYFCVLLSCCLVQKGKETEGLLGFLYPDILAELDRSKKHKCSYCGLFGATLGCSVTQCRKQFHLPCGRERHAVSLFYDNYKSYCETHAPKQKIADHIMIKARARKQELNKISKTSKSRVMPNAKQLTGANQEGIDSVCLICYEDVQMYPTPVTFWPPCCARDAWFHTSCVQRMALNAGMHYLKCPLCNDKDTFFQAALAQGIYVPDRDAAWELEQNAFVEIYERPIACSATECSCPLGRKHDDDMGPWDIKMCLLCGSLGVHAACLQVSIQMGTPEKLPSDSQPDSSDSQPHSQTTPLRYICPTCNPVAPDDIEELEASIAKVILAEQVVEHRSRRQGPVMPSRMSLRLTKRRMIAHSSTSAVSRNDSDSRQTNAEVHCKDNTIASRLDLNLKPTKKPPSSFIQPNILKNIENTLLSPIKMLEQSISEMSSGTEKAIAVDVDTVVERMRQKFKKPTPLCVKRKIVNQILGELMINCSEKSKEPLKDWISPKKYDAVRVLEFNNKEPTEHTQDSTNNPKISSVANPCENITNENTQDITLTTIAVDLPHEEVAESNNVLEKTESLVNIPRSTSLLTAPKKPNLNDIEKAATEETSLKYLHRTETQSTAIVDPQSLYNTYSNKSIIQVPEVQEPLTAKNQGIESLENTILRSLTMLVAEPFEQITARTSGQCRLYTESHESPNTGKNYDTREENTSVAEQKDTTTAMSEQKTESLEPEIENSNETSCEHLVVEEAPIIAEDINGKDKILSNKTLNDIDESSNSTFQLPSEFIADTNSNDSLPIFETPKKLTTVNIQKGSSLEISESDQIININVTKMDETDNKEFLNGLQIKSPVKTKKCSFKFSPIDKESLETENVNIDMEIFKNQYLNEVGKDFKCNFSHKHCDSADDSGSFKLRTAIDFAIDAAIKEVYEKSKQDRKRKLLTDEKVIEKKRKIENHNTENTSNNAADKRDISKNTKKFEKIKINLFDDNKSIKNENNNFEEKHIPKAVQNNKNIEKRKEKRKSKKLKTKDFIKNENIKTGTENYTTYNNENSKNKTLIENRKQKRRRKKTKKLKTKLSINEKNIKVKIRLKNEEVKLKITKSKTKNRKIAQKPTKKLKQYVLNYSPEGVKSSGKYIEKPDFDTTPLKSKYSKHLKSPSDNLVQTSIDNFFKIKYVKTE